MRSVSLSVPPLPDSPASLPAMSVQAIRGATTVAEDSESAVRAACGLLFHEMMTANAVDYADMVSVFVTTTADIRSMFPAKALREECGLDDVPLMGALEADIEGGLLLAIRVMLHINTDKPRNEIQHVFQGGATSLRPDIANR